MNPYLEIVVTSNRIGDSEWFYVESVYQVRFDRLFRVELNRRVTGEQYITDFEAEEYYKSNFPEYPLGNQVVEYERPITAVEFIRDSNEMGIYGKVSLKDPEGKSMFTLNMDRGDYEDELLGLLTVISRVVISDQNKFKTC